MSGGIILYVSFTIGVIILHFALQEIEQQFPAEKFQVVTKTHFQFQEASTPSISMAVNCPASDWSLTVDNNAMVSFIAHTVRYIITNTSRVVHAASW